MHRLGGGGAAVGWSCLRHERADAPPDAVVAGPVPFGSVQVDVLGPLRVAVDGEAVEIAAAKERGIVEMLALRVGRPVPVLELIGALWGDSPPQTARKTLQGYVSRLRKLLGAHVLVTETGSYTLAIAPRSVDAHRFEALAEEGRTALETSEPGKARDTLSEALNLWRGPPIADLVDGEASSEIARLEELRLHVVERLADARLALGRHEDLVADLERLVAEHPYRESLWSRLMLALYRCGRQRDALQAYRRARDLLVDELGIEPGPELQQMERAVLDQDPALDADRKHSQATTAGREETPHLPTGTVTFLITDIEGSTRRWQEDEAMAWVLARHDEIVREMVESDAGHLLKHVGDGAIAVFPTAAGALESAIRLQRAIRQEDWGDAPLRVRVAVHTGEAEERDGDYFGPAVNLAARLVDAAHGGQVLVSSATQEVVGGALPDDVSLLDLGEHRLRDIDNSMRVFQVQAPGVEAAFPPLRTPTAARFHLPAPRSSFVGRDEDLTKIAELVDTRRLVTLVGVGGAGKTRLAIEVARRAVDRFPDGVHFADLSSVHDAAGVLHTVAEALGMPDAVPTSPAAPAVEESPIGHVHERATLLVLDNCEHLIEECAAIVDRLLDAAPRVAVLATSREALGIEGEQWWPVGSLELPATDTPGERADATEAMRLLVQRIQAVRPGFEVDVDTRAALVDICVGLDGIPLALELAAGRAAHLSPREIADRLEHRLSLLTGGRGRVPRQQTLHATLDWSYDLLDAEEQVVLRRLSVFSGGFTLDAVEGVCTAALDASAGDVLASLVERSLVARVDEEGRSRYRLLETIRLYADEKLVEAREVESTRSRHRDHFLGLLETEPWDRCLLSEPFGREMAPDGGNLRAAFEWCHVQKRPDLLRRLLLRIPLGLQNSEAFAVGSPWFDRAVEYERTLPRREWVCHLIGQVVANNLQWTGDLKPAEAGIREIEEIVDALPDGTPATAYGYFAHAYRLSTFGVERAQEMEQSCDRAIEHAGAAVPLVRLWASAVKSIALLYLGRSDSAAALLEDVRHSDEWDADSETPWIALPLSVAHYLEGSPSEALDALATDLSLADTWKRTGEIVRVAALGALGRLDEAHRVLHDTIAWVRNSGWAHPLAGADCLAGCAVLAALEGDTERASRLAAAGRITSVPWPALLVRHHVELLAEELDRETRQRCIEEGRSLDVDDALGAEFARWKHAGTPASESRT